MFWGDVISHRLLPFEQGQYVRSFQLDGGPEQFQADELYMWACLRVRATGMYLNPAGRGTIELQR